MLISSHHYTKFLITSLFSHVLLVKNWWLIFRAGWSWNAAYFQNFRVYHKYFRRKLKEFIGILITSYRLTNVIFFIFIDYINLVLYLYIILIIWISIVQDFSLFIMHSNTLYIHFLNLNILNHFSLLNLTSTRFDHMTYKGILTPFFSSPLQTMSKSDYNIKLLTTIFVSS